MSNTENTLELLTTEQINKIKAAQTEVQIIDLIKDRWSPRCLSSENIEPEKIEHILEAGRWAPSGSNEQPWRIIIGTKNSDTWHILNDSLHEFNAAWAGNAPILMLVIGKKKRENGTANHSYEFDAGQCVAYMSLQAKAENIYCHQMGGFEHQKVCTHLNIDTNEYTPIVIIAFGYQGNDIGKLHPTYQKSEQTPRQRKPLSEWVSYHKWD